MINLLPPKEKEEFFIMRAKKMAVIFGVVVLVSLLSLVLVLASVRFYILAQITGFPEPSFKSYPKSENLKDTIKKYNFLLMPVLSFYEKDKYFGDILENISKVKRPAGLYFKSISLSNKKDGKKTEVNIAGFAGTRDNLILFKNNFEKETGANLYFTPESWISPANVNFNFSYNF